MPVDSVSLPSLQRLREHLGAGGAASFSDGEILDALNAAVEIVMTDIGLPLVTAALADAQEHPALRWALMEFVRDMLTSVQNSGLPLGVDVAEEPDVRAVVTLGRPTIPPYVRGLLAPYAQQGATAPRGSFPAATVYPAW